MPNARAHGNLATGVDSLTLAVADVDATKSIYESALGARGDTVERPDLDAAGTRFALGPHQLQIVAPVNSSALVAERLRMRGPSPIEVRLKGSGANPGLLDIGRAHDARIVLG